MEYLGVELTVVLINTIIITGVLAPFVLWRYRKAVLTGMQEVEGAVIANPPPSAARARSSGDESRQDALDWERIVHRRVARTYLLSVLVCALPLGFLYLYGNDLPPTPMHIIASGLALVTAAVPMVAVSLGWSWRRGLLLAFMVLVAGATAMTITSMVQRPFYGRSPSLDQLLNFPQFFAMAGMVLMVPAALLLASSASVRTRGVVPAIFGGLIVFGLAPWLGIQLTRMLIDTSAGLGMVMATVSSLGLNGAFLALSLPVGFIAWLRIHRLARSYEAKRLSDVQLTARMWWLMFVASVALDTVSRGHSLVTFSGCAAVYLAFPIVNRWLFRSSGLARGRAQPRTLLILRTFGFQKRTERLFDRIGSRWRYFGPVTVIAAPDVIARTVDAGDFLGWLTGRVDESFIRTQADLDERLATFDGAPDPDGRYRIIEFCCRNNTWQATVVSLMDRADAVVMDLRALHSGNAGVAFELEQLSSRVDPQRVVLVVDRSTDHDMLRRAAGEKLEKWRVIPVEQATVAETDATFEALIRAAVI